MGEAMRVLKLFALLISGLLCSCSPSSKPTENARPGMGPVLAPPAPRPLKVQLARPLLQNEQFSFYRDTTLLFGKYIFAHDNEGYAAVFYKPYPDSGWVKLSQVYGRSVELDTANIDKQGGPELLLTIEYKRSGSPDYGTVSTLHVLRTGPTLDLLFATRVECANYHHSWENGELNNFGQTQQVTAGYGFLRIGPVQTTCERSHSTAPCECDAQDLREAGGVPFVRPGRYHWRRGRLAWVSSR
jgi:hypothetical protein